MIALVRFAAIAFLLAGTAGASAAAQEVVPGPWGDLVDPVSPRVVATDEERVTILRRSQMRAMSGHFRSIEAVVTHGARFDGHARRDAAALEVLADGLPDVFVPGTAANAGERGAQPGIWEQPDKFARHIAGLQEAARGLSAALAADSDAESALTGVRHQCLACHQSYRVRAGGN